MFKTSWNYAFFYLVLWVSHHGVCFSWASLPVGENGSVVAFQNIFHQLSSSFFEDLMLLRLFGKDLIEAEYFFVFMLTKFVVQCNLFFIQVVADKLWTF